MQAVQMHTVDVEGTPYVVPEGYELVQKTPTASNKAHTPQSIFECDEAGGIPTGVDPSQFRRISPNAPVQTTGQEETIAELTKPKKSGFLRRLGLAAKNIFLLPFRIVTSPFRIRHFVAKKIDADLARDIGRIIRVGGGGGGFLVSAAFLARHLFPQVVHQALRTAGFAGIMGPQGLAVAGAVAFGALAIGAIAVGYRWKRAAKQAEA